MSTTLDTMSFQGPDGLLFVLRQVHWQAVGFVKVLPMAMLFWHPVLSFSFNGFYVNKLEFARAKPAMIVAMSGTNVNRSAIAFMHH